MGETEKGARAVYMENMSSNVFNGVFSENKNYKLDA
jgi:hypothetical protein